LIEKWWLIILTMAVTLGVVSLLTITQKPTYQTSVTYILRPNISDEDARDLLSGLDVLSRREEIANTYAEVAISRFIKNKAVDILGLSSEEKEDLTVSSRLLAGTNVLEITITGTNPTMVRDFANTVGEETVNYVQELYETYQLAHLDPAELPVSPIKPSEVINLSFGLFFGIVLGMGLAFLAYYLQSSRQIPEDLELLQPGPSSGVEEPVPSESKS
jgi:capsular polysaccharide biosynthesis protein